MPSLPHFNQAIASALDTDYIRTNQYDLKFFDTLGRELEYIHCTRFNIQQDHNSTSIKTILHSATEYITNYDNISRVKYMYFSINHKGKILESRIYHVSLMGIQCRFDYSMDESFQENDCDFMVYETHNMDNNTPVNDAIKTIIRGEKLNNILEE
jgi:hypothetical protein